MLYILELLKKLGKEGRRKREKEGRDREKQRREGGRKREERMKGMKEEPVAALKNTHEQNE